MIMNGSQNCLLSLNLLSIMDDLWENYPKWWIYEVFLVKSDLLVENFPEFL